VVDPVGWKAYWSEKVRLQDGTSKAGYRNCRTTSFSMTRVRTGVTEIGLKSEQSLGEGVFAIGEMIACFHWSGTKDEAIDWLKRYASGLQKTVAPSLRNQAGI